MIKNADFNVSVDKNPYKFRHYDISEFLHYGHVNRVPSEDLTLDMDHKKTSVMGYRTLFEGSGIHHSNSGLQITQHALQWLFHATVSSHARQGCLGEPYVTPREWQYQDRTAIQQTITRVDHVPEVP